MTGTELVPVVQNGQTVQTTIAAMVNSPTQAQTFITANQEVTLPNSRRLVGGLGIGESSGAPQGQFSLFLNGVSGSLENASVGVIVKNSSSTVVSRNIATSGLGLTVTNADGLGGNPTLSLSGLPLAITGINSTGFITTSGGNTVGTAVITGTSNQIAVAGGDGSSTPTISIANNPIFPGVGSVTVPNGTTGQRLGSLGAMRYNTTLGAFEGFLSTGWQQFSSAGGVVSFSTTLSGLTPNSPTGGAIVLGGVLGVSSGGTGATTLTGYVKGSGTTPLTASSTVPTTDLSGTITNAQLANSSILINSTSVSLGGSVNVGTVTSVSGTLPIQSSGGNAPTISITQASTSSSGYLSATDWDTFNNKQPAGSYVTSVGATTPVVSSGGVSPTISIPQATSSVNGYLSSADWTTFNSKGSGSVTSVSGTGSVNGITLTGTVTSSGSIVLGGALANIANNQLTNSAITVNGTAISLGGSATIAVPVGTITGLGTGVPTALAVNVGSAGAFVTFNGALGTPSSGTVTNLTGTASININGTVGATTPTTGNFTTVTASAGISGGGF
jgi:hypothetical protein